MSAGTARLPGVAITVTATSDGSSRTTSSRLDGSYVIEVAAPGSYQLKAELAAFAPAAQDVVLGADCRGQVDLALVLASRVPKPTAVAANPVAPPTPVPQPAAAPPAATAPGRPPAAGGFQRVAPVADAAAQGGGQQAVAAAGATADPEAIIAHLSLPPGFSPTELGGSITAFGTAGQVNEMQLFGGRGGMMFPGREGLMQLMGDGGLALDGRLPGEAGAGMAGGLGGLLPAAPGGMGGGRGMGEGPGGRGMGEGPGGRGGGMGGRQGGMPGLAGRLGMAAQRMNNRPRVQASYNLGASALDARPYSLTGQPTEKPGYLQQRFTTSVGGQLKIPKLFDAGPRTSFFLNYSGNRSSNAYDQYSTVPSLAARAGDFSSLAAPLLDPATRQPFPGNQIPAERLSPTAQALLRLIPRPNQPGDTRNYYYSTTTGTTGDDVNLRLIRSFGAAGQRPGGRGGGGRMGGRGGGAGGGVNLNVGVHYSRSETTQANPFPAIAGSSHRTGWDIPVNLNFPTRGLLHSVRLQVNRNRSETTNAFASVQDVAGQAGIAGVSTDPFAWGAPTLSFSSVSGLRDINPSLRLDRTFTAGDTVMRMLGRHTLRFGGEFRTQSLESRADANARGSYVFTGLYTGGGTRVGGFDFADFLIGFPQQASVQYGPGLQTFRSRSFAVFFQDDWRVRGNLTLNAGVRYEYQSPFSEAGNRLVNLDVAPDFTAVTPVVAGGIGPISGTFPASLVEPDWNNLAPRIGIAWRPLVRTVVRGGYAINYASVPYLSLVQKMAGQAPFAVTDTRIGTLADPLLLADAFGTPLAPDTVTTNFGVDRAYRLGYVQIWNVDIQREIGRIWSAGLAYTGTKGSSLDMLRAPNRGPSGLLIEGVQPFTWESSEGRSVMHALSVRLRRRLAQGISGGATYTVSKARDNASSLGGGGGVVAQNDRDLEAEWGPSSFNRRHQLSADFSLELPFGPNRRWLTSAGWASAIVGGWMMNGNLQVASGAPFTARVTGDVGDVARGTNGTLRADYNGAPIALDDPTIARFFNTAAFTVPAPGTFGTAGRNTITGPASLSLNMALMKNFQLPGARNLSLQVRATNVFNRAIWSAIDTTVNSPTFGQVVGVRPMRSVQINMRVMF